MTLRSMDVVFRSLGFAIQKGLAALLVARLHIYIYIYENDQGIYLSI
jgi:hypothetical protein